MIENRKFYRLPFRSKFVYASEQKVSAGNAVNISAGGVFVLTLETLPRGSICHCLFPLYDGQPPCKVKALVRRVVVPSMNPEEVPGMGLAFQDADPEITARLTGFMEDSRRNFELAATILASGEPDMASLQPLLSQMHLPQTLDLGELRYLIERILKAMELVDRAQTES
jgi:hypothetical protein